jgi:sorbitol/mannitol transport system substrate-binding protein
LQAACLGAALAVLCACGSKESTTILKIAAVNNGDMVLLKKLTSEFERQNPNIHLKWILLEENVLRQRVTTDVATGAGQFDVVTIGNYEVPIWARQGWLASVPNLSGDYDVGDLLKPVRDSVTYRGAMYALPFYAESAMTYYRTDLFAKAGLRMPNRPTYTQIAAFARILTDRSTGTYGICLRGKPGWGENMATVTSLVNAFGGRWFDAKWHAQIDSPQWYRAITYYSDLLKSSGPPGITSNGFNENLVLFAGGHCAIWIDSTVAAPLLYDTRQSSIDGKVGYAPMPSGDDPAALTWLWSWDLAVPGGSKHAAAAMKFTRWATSKEYIRLIAKIGGWLAVPPGTRQSTYDAREYRQAAPFAGFVLNAINTAAGSDPNARIYGGAQFVDIPEFQGIGTTVGQTLAAILSGQETVNAALEDAQAATERTMRHAGYLQ